MAGKKRDRQVCRHPTAPNHGNRAGGREWLASFYSPAQPAVATSARTGVRVLEAVT